MISVVIISKDEPSLGETLTKVEQQAGALGEPSEIIVVDASEGRLDHIRQRHAQAVRWVCFERPPGVAVSIPHQRNAGVRAARGEIIVFTDVGCHPREGWLARLVAPLRQGENVAAGLTLASSQRPGVYDNTALTAMTSRYLRECATINLAFHREAFDAVGGFDERFAYGSDIDFTWRLVDAGYRIRNVPDAVIEHDWGTWRRQARRSYAYGKARARLYRKHRGRLKRMLRDDPVAVIYPVFLLGLPLTPILAVFSPGPLTLIFPLYLGLLLIPAWRNRSIGSVRAVVDHLIYGAGVIAELIPR